MIRVLSRLPERSMLGLHGPGQQDGATAWFFFFVFFFSSRSYFSIEVAKLVTQPFCRSRVSQSLQVG